MPLMRKVAKRGFNNRYFAPKVAIVNLYQIEENFENGAVVNVESLVASGLVKGKFDTVKVLGTGDIKKSVTVKVPSISQSAVEKIEKAGGKVEIEL